MVLSCAQLIVLIPMLQACHVPTAAMNGVDCLNLCKISFLLPIMYSDYSVPVHTHAVPHCCSLGAELCLCKRGHCLNCLLVSRFQHSLRSLQGMTLVLFTFIIQVKENKTMLKMIGFIILI